MHLEIGYFFLNRMGRTGHWTEVKRFFYLCEVGFTADPGKRSRTGVVIVILTPPPRAPYLTSSHAALHLVSFQFVRSHRICPSCTSGLSSFFTPSPHLSLSPGFLHCSKSLAASPPVSPRLRTVLVFIRYRRVLYVLRLSSWLLYLLP